MNQTAAARFVLEGKLQLSMWISFSCPVVMTATRGLTGLWLMLIMLMGGAGHKPRGKTFKFCGTFVRGLLA